MHDGDAVYHAHGVRFRFPESWDLSEDETGAEVDVSLTVSGPGTSFWSLMLFFDGPPPERLVDSAVDAFREEYDELDVYPAEATLCRRPAVARDVEFVCFELLNGASLRSVRTDRFSALVLYQGTDDELEQTRRVLEAITESLQCDEDEMLFSP